jgi:hypothetical protein
MLEILCGAKCEWMVLCLPNDFFFLLTSKVYFTILHIQLGLPHPLALAYHITFVVNLWTLWGSTFFDVMQYAFASSVKDVRFHVLHEQTHILPPPTFWSMHQ